MNTILRHQDADYGVCAENNFGQTALREWRCVRGTHSQADLACQSGGSLSIILMLVNAGAGVQDICDEGVTPVEVRGHRSSRRRDWGQYYRLSGAMNVDVMRMLNDAFVREKEVDSTLSAIDMVAHAWSAELTALQVKVRRSLLGGDQGGGADGGMNHPVSVMDIFRFVEENKSRELQRALDMGMKVACGAFSAAWRLRVSGSCA